MSAAGASRPRRAYHTKAKTGCWTCRIREVRCDERKPECVRCASTGRKCDGYTSSSRSPSVSSTSASVSSLQLNSPDAAADLKLTLPRQSPEEVRSYRYFLEVTAPSLAGAFYADFWLVDVPRVCLSDGAIWHAVVSLGSAHKDFAEHGRGSRSVFVLRQFNSSIRCLNDSRSPRHADRWRALVTRIHLQAGCNLLHELQDDGTAGITTSKQKRLQQIAQWETSITSALISLAPVQSILINLKLHADALDHGGVNDSPTLLSPNKIINAWRFCTAPQPSHPLTPEKFLFSQEHAKQLEDLQTEDMTLDDDSFRLRGGSLSTIRVVANALNDAGVTMTVETCANIRGWLGSHVSQGDMCCDCKATEEYSEKLLVKDKKLFINEGAYHCLHLGPEEDKMRFIMDAVMWILERN
ncbi:Aspercryptin biosynthesis cluster-specific transcription regulator atnN [Paramyrothecium foliicola]|nr:Aspercryptin biosynthesis cluster-specific transcription regulator atnN [Paramyrothecium foliicola]